MMAEPPRLQKRNVEVFESGGAVVAGKYLRSDGFRPLVTVCRILAIWYPPVGRVLQIHDCIGCHYDSLDDFPI